MDMLRRGWKMGLYAKYVITDSWFTCEQLMACVRSIGRGAMHFVGLAKMGKTKYTVLGRKKNAAELIATYERERGKNCRKYKCRYIQLSGNLGDIPVRIFLIRYGRNSAWNVLLTTDTTMSFVKAFEVYQNRWNIEVMNKETKQYLGLGSYQGCDFNGQIADATLCYPYRHGLGKAVHRISNHGRTLFRHGGQSHGTHVMGASSCLYRTHSSHFRRSAWDDAPIPYGYNQWKRQRDEQNPCNG